MILSSRFLKLRQRCLANCGAAEELSRFVWSAKWLRDIEPDAARAHDMTLAQLMVRAGTAAYEVAAKAYPSSVHWLIVVGTGNNGGDGYVMAKLAKKAGRHVTVLSIEGKENTALPLEASTAKAAWEAVGGTHSVYDPSIPFSTTLKTSAPSSCSSPVDLVVDGLLGTGITGAPRQAYATLIEHVNALPAPCLAIDIPSGLNAETGEVAGACIKASHTVSFISLKPGLLTGHARAYTGQLHYSTLGLEKWLAKIEHLAGASGRRLCVSDLPVYFGRPRSATAHKGSSGKVLLIGGDYGYGGAIIMAAESCLASGAGLTRVLTRHEHVGPILTRCPEVMVEAAKEAEKDLAVQLQSALSWCSTIAVGPGLGTSHIFGELVMKEVLSYAKLNPDKPLVMDADGLNVLAKLKNSQKGHNIFQDGQLGLRQAVITPHPGEAARLLQCSVTEVEKNRVAAAKRLSDIIGGICLLKGPGTIVYECSSRNELRHAENHTKHEATEIVNESKTSLQEATLPYAIIDAGNASMAIGGSGDVLTGIVASVAAQNILPLSLQNSSVLCADSSEATEALTEGKTPWISSERTNPLFHAVCAGALVHSVAADLASESGPIQSSWNESSSGKLNVTRGLRPTQWIPFITECVNCGGAI